MKINNFNLIKNVLNFQLEKFYYLQIICRGKDCGENKIINSYFIRTKEQLEKLEEAVIEYTKITREEYNESKKDDVWYLADEALEKGICDEILGEFI